MESASDAFANCLCLVCRQTGHIVEKCPSYMYYQWDDLRSTGLPPDFEPTYPTFPFTPLTTIKESTRALCQRCHQFEDGLGNIATYRPFVGDDLEVNHSKRATKKVSLLPSLGPILSLHLLSTCPFCRLLFDMTELEDDDIETVRDGGELRVVIGWIINRLEENLYWDGCEKGKGPYAKCVYTSVTSWSLEDRTCEDARLVGDALDAIGPVDIEDNASNDGPALGVRPVNPRIPDYNIIKGWLQRCNDLHDITCRPLVSDSLKQIKLIDLETRRVVMYPTDGCEYVAVSYVWGNVQQPSYKLGDVLPTVPATLEDAMTVTQNMGKRYFWADSLCMNQSDDGEKTMQVALMSAIYSGAWATIICLSSQSAHSGLPRVGTLDGVLPQLSCEIWGQKLLSVMPTLDQQIRRAPWTTRAWTFQEGLLSPRCLFFTDHQVYFECNSVQCCESLNESSSPFHLLSDEQRRAVLDEEVQEGNGDVVPECVIGRGVLRDPFRPISRAEEAQIDGDKFKTYLNLVGQYSMRQMTHDADSLNAFSAILTCFERDHYKKGFVHGLPIEDIPRALLWFHDPNSDPPRRRIDFPSWSWVGWEGQVNGDIDGAKSLPRNEFMPPLRVWRAGQGDHPELIYEFNPTPHIKRKLEEPPEEEEDDDTPLDDVKDSDSDAGYESDSPDEDIFNRSSLDITPSEDDPVFHLSRKLFKQKTPTVLPKIDHNELLIEGIVIRLCPVELSKDDSDSDCEMDDSEYDSTHRCCIRLNDGSVQRVKFYGHDAEQLANERCNMQHEFLLVSREQNPDKNAMPTIHNALLLIDRDGDAAKRVGVVSLELDQMELLEQLEPQKMLFKLR